MKTEAGGAGPTSATGPESETRHPKSFSPFAAAAALTVQPSLCSAILCGGSVGLEFDGTRPEFRGGFCRISRCGPAHLPPRDAIKLPPVRRRQVACADGITRTCSSPPSQNDARQRQSRFSRVSYENRRCSSLVLLGQKGLGIRSNSMRETVPCSCSRGTRARTDRVARMLRNLGHNVKRLHGDRTQSQRTKAIEGSSSQPILRRAGSTFRTSSTSSITKNSGLRTAFSQTARESICPKGHFFAAQSAKKPRIFRL